MNSRPSVALAMLLGLAMMPEVLDQPSQVFLPKSDDDEREEQKRKTERDQERIAAAQAKRERRAAKRRALNGASQ